MVVVFPDPFTPTKHITKGFFSFILSIKSKESVLSRSSIEDFSVEPMVDAILERGIGLSTNCTFRSPLIFSITSTATLFSNNATSRSQNNSSNWDSLILLVVIVSFILAKNPCCFSWVGISCSRGTFG